MILACCHTILSSQTNEKKRGKAAQTVGKVAQNSCRKAVKIEFTAEYGIDFCVHFIISLLKDLYFTFKFCIPWSKTVQNAQSKALLKVKMERQLSIPEEYMRQIT